ncbi:MAG: hypothetical protein JXR37_12850 [Kiritimatiellae bacterium]|nr:hypothetical protein [Kiritimatiellia bacterium]
MRIFVYGMQSSGASLVTYLLAQKEDSLALIDLFSGEVAPSLPGSDAADIVVKGVITAAVPLERHVASFNPDKTVLVCRHPYHNFVSLRRKSFRDDDGTVEQKFRILERIFVGRARFDLVVLYEDVLTAPDRLVADFRKLGWWDRSSLRTPTRTPEAIRDDNCRRSAWCAQTYDRKWGFGQLHAGRAGRLQLRKCHVFKFVTADEKRVVREWCPGMVRFYEDYLRRHPWRFLGPMTASALLAAARAPRVLALRRRLRLGTRLARLLGRFRRGQE